MKSSASSSVVVQMLEHYKLMLGLQHKLDNLTGRLEWAHGRLQGSGADRRVAKAHRDHLVHKCVETLDSLRETRRRSQGLLGLA